MTNKNLPLAEETQHLVDGWDLWIHTYQPEKTRFYRGVRTLKYPIDMWRYQELMFTHNVHWVIEMGTLYGGSAMYFADTLKNMKRSGKVITVDQNKNQKATKHNPEVVFIEGQTLEQLDAVKKHYNPKVSEGTMLILDSCHRTDYVTRELGLYVPLLTSGDVVIVEDNASAGPIWLSHNPGILIRETEVSSSYGGSTLAKNGYFLVI